MGKPRCGHHCTRLPTAWHRDAWCECGLCPSGVTGEDKAGEAAGTVARNILAEALSWRSGKAFVAGTCNGFQERASIFAANRGTKDVESYCGLSKEELILGQAALVRRGSSAGRATGGAVIYEQL